MNRRDFDEDTVQRWKSRLGTGDTLDEHESSRLLSDFGFPINPARLADNESEVVSTALELGYPLVLKTAEPGILHKTDQQGVRLRYQK